MRIKEGVVWVFFHSRYCLTDIIIHTQTHTLSQKQAVEQLALAAGVYQFHQPAPSPPLLDHEALRRHMRWMKKQHDKAPAGTAAQWVDKYRPEEPNMLVNSSRGTRREEKEEGREGVSLFCSLCVSAATKYL